MTSRANTAKTADTELLITRTFDAPASLVFSIWESREHMQRWLGPKGFTCTSLAMDFRAGGSWRACIVSKAYGESWMGGRYVEIERGKRIVYTFAWEDGRDQPGVETVVTVTFEENDGKTTQTFHQAPFVHVDARDSHIDGWNQCFDKEQAYAETLAKEVRT
jgi:uncharacterized protein YndB with AHSA1/START domain